MAHNAKWPPGFTLDQYSVRDSAIWGAATIDQLTSYRIDDFLTQFDDNGDFWDYSFWLDELKKRFFEIGRDWNDLDYYNSRKRKEHQCDRIQNSVTLKEKDKNKRLKSLKKELKKLELSLELIGVRLERRMEIGEIMFEIFLIIDASPKYRFNILSSFNPHRVQHFDWGGPKDHTEQFFDEMVAWSQNNAEEGLIGLYAQVIEHVDYGEINDARDLLIEEINLQNDSEIVISLMSLLCDYVGYYAHEMAVGGWSRVEYASTPSEIISEIRRIANSDESGNR